MSEELYIPASFQASKRLDFGQPPNPPLSWKISKLKLQKVPQEIWIPTPPPLFLKLSKLKLKVVPQKDVHPPPPFWLKS